MKITIVAIFLGMLLITGCHPANNDTFYWGDYSSTLYALKKNPSDSTLSVHKKQVLTVINESADKKKQVPPGIYAEYGYLLLKNGDVKNGIDYLDKELILYPESSVFINRLKNEYARGKK